MKIIFPLTLLIIVSLNASAQSPYMLSDVNSLPLGTNVSFQGNLASLSGFFYFVNDDAITGSELWKTDGTVGGTSIVKDINPGIAGSAVRNLSMQNNLIYFAATNGINGIELWKTDGTSAGTIMLKDIYAGSSHSQPGNFTNVNGTIFFTANDDLNYGNELWKTNGTAAGTVLVKDIWIGGGGYSSDPSELININGTLFFAATTGDRELWKSDGTAAGTVEVKNINLTSCCDLSSMPHDLTNVNGTLYFTADDGSHGSELWVSNGTTSGTVLMADIYPGALGSNPTGLTWVPETSTLYYAANNGVHGQELHSFNPLGVGLEADINPVGSSNPKDLININGILYFSADDGVHGYEVWQSDFNLTYTSPTTTLLIDLNPGLAASNPTSFIKIADQIYFKANDGIHGVELFKTNGTETGTVLVKDIFIGTSSSYPTLFTNVINGTSNKLFFVARESDNINPYFKYWTFGNCNRLNRFAIKSATVFNQENQTTPSTLSCHCDIINNLVTSINSTGSTPVNGNINSRVWVELTQPINYAKRHYEIIPDNNPTGATGKITLYFTQLEFTNFNAINTIKLPINGTDAANNKANLLIEKRTGVSSNGTGLPISYPTTAAPVTINPADADIFYNSLYSRWEVSFNVTGFGAFFVKTTAAILPNIYTFTGSGDWNITSNWLGGYIPPTNLTAPHEILIDPIISGECVLPITNIQTIANAAKITVVAGKKLIIGGTLIIQ